MNISNELQRFFRIHQRPKVFCIGYNKTGTTTLERVLTNLGYRMPNQARQESMVVEELFRGNYEPLSTLCKKYDAFQDMPFSYGVTYAIVDAMFPGSKFILTVREPNAWFESLVRFHLSGILKKAGVEKVDDFSESSFKDKAIYLHKNYMHNVIKRYAVSVVDHEVRYDWSLVYDKQYQIELYERRNQEIVDYFQDRQDQLLVLDITKEQDNAKIVEFLDLPKRLIDTLPHLNRSQ
jgi:hypothetical protein